MDYKILRKKKQNFRKLKQQENKKINNQLDPIKIIIIIFILIFITFEKIKLGKKLKVKEKEISFEINSKNFKYIKYEEEFKNKNSECDTYDPIFLFKQRTDKSPIEICSNGTSKHICYQNINNHYNDIFGHKNGVICTMENIVLDPSCCRQTGFSYMYGPEGSPNNGFPSLDKGFFNAQCKVNNPNNFNYNSIYDIYFNSWNYDYDIEKENLEELSPGKIVFFISRNKDSPNLFHGNSEIVNVLSMIYLFNLDPDDIQVIFIDSIEIPYYKEETPENKDIPRDPFYDIYNKIISRGGEPIYIKSLKKKYKISKAIHVPHNWDSPLYMDVDRPKCDSTVKSYKFYNDFVDKYMDIKPFKDSFITDNEIYYYPETVIKNHESKIKFDKTLTFQWRRVWPKKRKIQLRLLSNAPQLADKLAKVLPKNILIRLIDTARLTMEEQISLIRSTDYLVGIHGAGLSLCIFLPSNSIYNELDHRKNTPKKSQLSLLSALSGHKTYIDEIKNTLNDDNGNQIVTFDEDDVANTVLFSFWFIIVYEIIFF